MHAQSCLTLCNPMDYGPPGSSDHESSWQEYWSWLPLPSPGDLPHPGIKPMSPTSLALQAKAFNSKPLGKKQNNTKHFFCKSVRTVVVCGSEPRLSLPLPFSAQLRETPPQTGADKKGQKKVFLVQTRGTWCYKEVAGEDSWEVKAPSSVIPTL